MKLFSINGAYHRRKYNALTWLPSPQIKSASRERHAAVNTENLTLCCTPPGHLGVWQREGSGMTHTAATTSCLHLSDGKHSFLLKFLRCGSS